MNKGFVIAIFVAVIIVFFLLYGNLGLINPFQNVSFVPPPAPQTGGVPSTISGNPTPAPIPSQNPSAPKYTNIPKGFAESDLSPYYEKITISYVSPLTGAFGGSAGYSEVSISAYNLGSGEKVDVTGWKVKSNKDSFIIPQAIDVFPPTNPENAVGDVRIQSGERVRLFSSDSKTGYNFRLNQCTGFFKSSVPATPKSCPSLIQSDIATLSGQCQSYLYSLGSCQMPPSNPPVFYSDTQCYDVLAKINYQGCYEKNHADKNFLSNEWWLWLGKYGQPQINILDPLHDRVLLFDGKGKLVDEYIY